MRTQPPKFIVNENGERVELTVDHNGKELTFSYPRFWGTHSETYRLLEEVGLRRPTMAEVTSLIHGAFFSNNKYGKKIREFVTRNSVNGYTGILYTPQGVAYIQEDPDIQDGRPFMDESELVRKLEASDPFVRTVPMGYPIGDMSPRELAANPFVQALATPKGAEKLAEVASKIGKSRVSVERLVKKPTTRWSALFCCLKSSALHYGLFVNCDHVGCYIATPYTYGIIEKASYVNRT